MIVEIAGLRFATKKATTDFFREMLHRYRLGEVVGAEDDACLDALLGWHPEAAEKRGVGVSHFFVGGSSHGTQCFFIRRADGSEIDFSFRWCVSNIGGSDGEA